MSGLGPTSGRATAGTGITGPATDGWVSSVQPRGASSSIRATRMGRISKTVGRVAKVAASTQAAAASAWDESPQGSRAVETSAPPAALVINMCLCLSLKNKGNGTAHFGAPLWAPLRNACFLGHGMKAQGSPPSCCCGPGRQITYAFPSRTLAGPGCATQR